MGNVLKQQPDYVISQSKWGVTRKYLYESGMLFREFKSHWKMGVLPLVHITIGINPETGKRLWAKGVIAIGRKSLGVIAIGQVSAGIIAISHLSIGVISIGQLAIGLVLAMGQVSVAGLFSAGQVAVGAIAIGQITAGYYALGQFAVGKFILSVSTQDYEAVSFFKSLWHWCTGLF